MKNIRNFINVILLFSLLEVKGQTPISADPIFQIKPQFTKANPFSEGLASVRIGDFENGKCGYIDKTGKFITPLYDDCKSFSQDLAAVRVGDYKNGKWGFINKLGELIITPQFTKVFPFSNGFSAVLVGDEKSGKWGFIDKNGIFSINPQYSFVGSFNEGLAIVQIGGDYRTAKWSYIDTKGKLVTGQLYESNWNFSEGLAGVNIGTKEKPDWVYINQSGEQVIKISSTHSNQFRWRSVNSFHEGVGQVLFEELAESKGIIWKLINKKGEILFNDDPSTESTHFSEGLAKVTVGKYPITKYGFFDKNGKMIITPQFDRVSDFKNGFAAFGVGSNENGLIGFIDKTGKIVINPIFKTKSFFIDMDFYQFNDGLAPVQVELPEGWLWGYIKAPISAR